MSTCRRASIAALAAWYPEGMSLPGGIIARFLSRLERPALFKIAATLFAVSLLVPDPLPLVDELLLGILTLLAARRKQPLPPVPDVSR